MVTLILMFLRVPGGVLFGIITFFFNFVPMIGAICASLLPIPILVLDPYIGGDWETRTEGTTTQRITWGAIAVALPLCVHVIVGCLVEPAVFGHKLELNPVLVLVMV